MCVCVCQVPAIDYIEKGLLAVRRQRAEQLCERQQADVKDQSKEFVSGKSSLADLLAWYTVGR